MSQHRLSNRRPLAGLLALTLTSGTLAGLGVLTAAPAGAATGPVCNQPTQTFAAGASGDYTVPAGGSFVDVVASGAAGGAGYSQSRGGPGATVSTRLAVSPGETLHYTVGSVGSSGHAAPGSVAGGLSGGAASGGAAATWYTGNYVYSGAGGGATFVTAGASLLVAAGAGGGGGYASSNGGGAGPAALTSGTAGAVFTGGNGSASGSDVPATGGSSVVGTGGVGQGQYGGNGHNGNGQIGGDAAATSGAGGGGGGYKGGGGGATNSTLNSGAAGSSYSASAYTIIGNGGAGSLTISAPADPLFQSADNTLFIKGQSNTFTVCAPGGPGTTITQTGTLPAGVTFTDNKDGTATLSGNPTVVGQSVLHFASSSSGGSEPQDFTLTVHDISATHFGVTVSPTSLTAGGSVSGTVTAYDAQGDVAATDNEALTLSSTDPQATLNGVTLVHGVGNFTGTLTTAGTQTITAAGATLSGTSNDVAVAPAAADSYTVVVPGTAVAGDTVDATITALDQFGNLDTNDSGDVALSSTDSSVVLPAVTLAAGKATASLTFTASGTWTVTATDPANAGIVGTSGDIAVAPAAAGSYTVVVPGTAVAGDTVDATITALDAFGNVDTNDGGDVTLSSTDSSVVLPAVTLAAGKATAHLMFTTSGTWTVTATDPANAGIVGTSGDIAVSPAAAGSYTVVVPGTAVAGDTVDATITAMDQFGNVDTNDSGDVTLTSDDTAAVLPDVSLTAGSATVHVILKTAGRWTVTATDPNSSSITGSSDVVVVSAGATSKLILSTATQVTAGSTNGIAVATEDPFGNATSSTDTVHFSSNDPHAVLPADGPANALVVPQDTFKTTGSWTLTVSDPGNSNVAASTVTVTVVPGPVQTLDNRVGDRQSTPAGHDFGVPLSVRLTDPQGNVVPGQLVVFSTAGDVPSSFGGQVTSSAISDANGVATSAVLTAGATVGQVTVTATATGGPVSYGSITYTESVTASDATRAATPKVSSGIGTAVQSATVSLPQGITITLLDGSSAPVTTVVTANGTYVLNPATGVISFVAVAGFSGTAAPVTYRLTDSTNLQATSTYTPTVSAPAPVVPPANPVAPPVVVPPTAPPAGHPVGVAHVRSASPAVLTGHTLPATCTVTIAAIRTCRTALTAQVAHRQVVLGTSSTVKAHAGATKVLTVIHLNALGRAMAAQVGGVKVTLWASVTKTDGRVLSAKSALTVVDKHVLVPAAVLFPNKAATLTPAALQQLKALKGHLHAVHTVTCVGYADSAGDAAANAALGKARAAAVCAKLAGHGVKVVVVSRGDSHPLADNATAAGRALNRRVEISLTY